jgi:ribonuclease HI
MSTDCVFTDGATSNNGKPNAKGGYGVFFSHGNSLNESQPFPNNFKTTKVTNNRCEFYAILRAIEIYFEYNPNNVQGKSKLIIYSDSDYSIKSLTIWIKKWKGNGWKTVAKKNVLNSDLIQIIDGYLTQYKQVIDIEFEHVRAHKSAPTDEISCTWR